jgi:hypothetical protein
VADPTKSGFMKQPAAAALLFLLMLSSIEAFGSSECSTDAFAAYGQTWAGVPISPNPTLVRPGNDENLCSYVAQAKFASVEEWYQQQLADAGWSIEKRESWSEGTTLRFRRKDEMFKLILMARYGKTIVIMHRPERDITTTPTPGDSGVKSQPDS